MYISIQCILLLQFPGVYLTWCWLQTQPEAAAFSVQPAPALHVAVHVTAGPDAARIPPPPLLAGRWAGGPRTRRMKRIEEAGEEDDFHH